MTRSPFTRSFSFLLWGVEVGGNSWRRTISTGLSPPNLPSPAYQTALWPRRRGDAGQENGENPGQKYSVEGPGAANRSDRRAEAADFIEIEQVRADQRSHRAADIGKRGRVFPGKNEGKNGCRHNRREYRHRDANARHRRRHRMNDEGDRHRD